MKRKSHSTPLGGIYLAVIFLAVSFSTAVHSQEIQTDERSVSPHLLINDPPNRAERRKGGRDGRDGRFSFKTRSIDGSGNNKKNPDMGAAFTELKRLLESDYGDGISSLAGENRPSAREVSNAVSAQDSSIPNSLDASDYLWQWGQFVDHDIDLTGGTDPAEPADITVPAGDPFFDPEGTGVQVIEFNRSIYN